MCVITHTVQFLSEHFTQKKISIGIVKKLYIRLAHLSVSTIISSFVHHTDAEPSSLSSCIVWPKFTFSYQSEYPVSLYESFEFLWQCAAVTPYCQQGMMGGKKEV